MIYLLAAVALLLGAGIAYQSLGLTRDRKQCPPCGRITATGLHVYELGSSGPNVVFEAGIAGSLLGWARVQSQISKFARTISYDRPGLGWSALTRKLRTVENMTAELKSIAPSVPFVLVGHSFGGLLARAYAVRWPDDVLALVLVDPVGISSWASSAERERRMLARGVALSKRGALLARFGIVRFALDLLVSGKHRFSQRIARATAGNGTSTLSRLVGETQLLPPDAQRAIRSHWSNHKCFTAMAQYLACLPESARYALNIQVPRRIPVTILSASTATPEELREREAWTAASDHGEHIVVNDCGHWIQIRRPDAVIEAVQRVCANIHATSLD